MIRNLKVLGLALVALFTMGVMVASTASAHTPAVFHVEKAPATITANQKGGAHTLTVTGQTITCENVALDGTTNELTPVTILMGATYSGCKTGLGTNATITGFAQHSNEIGEKGKCWYKLNADGSAALLCNEGEVTVDAATCVVHLPAQEFKNAVHYTTEQTSGGKHDLTVSFGVTGVTANHTDGFLCPLTGSGHSTGASFSGASTAIAETDDGANEPLHLTHTPTVP